MNVIITINDSNQDKSLKVAFEAEMKKNEWKSITEVENSFIKNFDSIEYHEVIKSVQKELDVIAYDAEWENLKFIVVSTNTLYSIMVANKS